jgi:zinc and cadmium transporter
MVAFTSAYLLIRNKSTAKLLASFATPFAAGALLAAVFFDLLPESIAESSSSKAMMSVITGLVLFFYLERFLRWFHHHHEHNDSKDIAPKSLIVIGDAIHNALDGVVIAAAFLVSVPAGIIAVFAIAAHEVPQEIGNIGLLLGRGMSRKNAMVVNALSVISTVLAAAAVFALGNIQDIPLGILLGISAGFLLYIATSDVIPLVHKQSKADNIFDIRPFLLLVGILIVGIVIYISRNFAV